jgi:hypothetical protein
MVFKEYLVVPIYGFEQNSIIFGIILFIKIICDLFNDFYLI